MTARRWQRASWFAIALTLLGFAVFVRLGVWQIDRAAQAQRLLDAFAAAEKAPPEDFAGVGAAPPPDRFPRVRVRGHYVGERGYLRDEQMHAGRLGVEAYGVFAIDGNDALLLVDRGWIAWDHAPGTQPVLPAPAAGDVALTGLYAPFPGSGLRAGGNALRTQAQWPKLTLAVERGEIAADLGRPLLPRLLLLDADAASGFTREWTPALLPPARHTAYAVQWFAFAIVALGAFVATHWRRQG